MEHYMTDEEMMRDCLVDRLHELVNDGRLCDAVAMYEEHREIFNRFPSRMGS